jgi:hypothetical protein
VRAEIHRVRGDDNQKQNTGNILFYKVFGKNQKTRLNHGGFARFVGTNTVSGRNVHSGLNIFQIKLNLLRNMVGMV